MKTYRLSNGFWRSLLAAAGLLALVTLTWGNVASKGILQEALASDSSRLYLPLVRNAGTDVSIAGVKIIQGISLSGRYTAYVAGRATEARVFVATGNGKPVAGIGGRMCGYDAGGGLLGCIEPENGPIAAPSTEGELASTLNFLLPADWLKPGTSFHAEIVPPVASQASQANDRFPQAGINPFQFVSTPPLNLVIVPVEYRPFGSSQSYLPHTGDLSYLTYLPIKLFPVPSVNYELHPPYTYSPQEGRYNLDNSDGQGWVQLLTEIASIHNMEDPYGLKNYYGLVNSFDAHSCRAGCITGIGYLGGSGGYQTAAGWSGWGAGSPEASETMSHELGHNFGRGHVRCTGYEFNPDTNYPYPDGRIGQYGLDPETKSLYDPTRYADYMSYCDPIWTSDYTFWNIYQHRQAAGVRSDETGQESQALYVHGVISPQGEVSLLPAYRQPAKIAPAEGGRYRVELLGERRNVLAEYAFDPVEIPDATGFYSFGFFIPDFEGLSGLRIREGGEALAEKFVREKPFATRRLAEALSLAPSRGRLTLRWGAVDHPSSAVVYRVRVSRDGGQNWQVLALDLPQAELPLPGGLEGGEVWLEIQASDGIHTLTQSFPLQIEP